MKKQISARLHSHLLAVVDNNGNFGYLFFFLWLILAEIPLFLFAIITVLPSDLMIAYIIKIVIGYPLCFLLLGLARKLKNPYARYGALLAFGEIYMIVLQLEFIPTWQRVLQRETLDLAHKTELVFVAAYQSHTEFFGFWFWLFPVFVAAVAATYAEIKSEKIQNTQILKMMK